MKIQVADYKARCGVNGRGCEIEEFVEDGTSPHMILGPGTVLSKCEVHAEVDDGDLYGVMQEEGRKIRDARAQLGPDGNAMRFRFKGKGYERELVVEVD